MGPDAMILVFWMWSFKPTFSLSSFIFIKRLFSTSLLSALRVESSAYLRLLIFLPVILILACASSSLAFRMMYSAYKLNKQGDNIQPWHTSFPILNQSVIPCPVLTVASWPAYRLPGRQEYTEELYKKDLHDPDNHDGVITHLEPDILECEVKWALGSITMNKASGGDGIPVELFQILKDDAVKVLHSIWQQIWKTQQWPQHWKRSVFVPVPRKAMPKNAQTTAQLHSSYTLAK